MGIYTGKVIRIGRIRANGRNLAVHMSINGRTCDTRRAITAEVGAAAALAGTRRCKTCFAPARIAQAQADNNHSDTRWSAAADSVLFELTQAAKTPEERAASAAKFADTQYAREAAARAATWHDETPAGDWRKRAAALDALVRAADALPAALPIAA